MIERDVMSVWGGFRWLLCSGGLEGLKRERISTNASVDDDAGEKRAEIRSEGVSQYCVMYIMYSVTQLMHNVTEKFEEFHRLANGVAELSLRRTSSLTISLLKNLILRHTSSAYCS